jgi:hypothetical protein
MATIVLIADQDDPKRGEIVTLDDAGEAERLIGGLLEDGCEQDRLRVFGGSEMDMRIAQRPVVALSADDVEELDAATAETVDGEATPDAAFVRDGVRFSSLFKTA